MTVLKVKSGAGGTTWEEVGGVGVGVPTGGSTNQVLAKTSAADYATAWVTPTGGGGGGDLLASLVNAEVTLTAATTLTSTAFGVMHVLAGTTTDFTVTLPSASGNARKLLGIRVAGSAGRLYTLAAPGGALIDGVASRVLWVGEAALLLCDGTGWFKIAGKTVPMAGTMHLSANQTLNPATMTKADIDTVDVDNTGTMADVTNRRIVIRRTSGYLVLGESVIWLQSAPANRAMTAVQKNGGQIISAETSGFVNGFPSPTAATVQAFAAGDAVTLHGYQDGSASGWLYGGVGGCQLSVTEVPQW